MAEAPETATGSPAATVRAYLDAMERRDLEAAKAFLAPGFAMHFPAAAPMTTLEQLVAWAAPRYRFVTKTYEAFEEADGGAVVWCRGALAGEWPDGTPFAGIRFVDRFALSGGLLARQDVWNDIAEVRARDGIA
jgi:hypothetical protein